MVASKWERRRHNKKRGRQADTWAGPRDAAGASCDLLREWAWLPLEEATARAIEGGVGEVAVWKAGDDSWSRVHRYCTGVAGDWSPGRTAAPPAME